MAKKSKSKYVTMTCSVCKSQNYTTTKNPENVKDKFVFKKFCSTCRKTTEHKEAK